MKTRDKIIFNALTLFNEQGERNVTTNHIAAHIDISPGNLYYHFANKQEIIRSIFELYSQELLEKLSPSSRPDENLTFLEHYMEAIFSLMWKYRFFYSNLPEILNRDPSLHQDYLQVQEELQANLLAITQEIRQLGLIEVTDEAMKSLVSTLHLVATHWLSYQIVMSTQTQVTEQVIQQGMQQMITIVKPLATEEGMLQLEALEKHLEG